VIEMILTLIGAYLLGSIPSAVWFGKWMRGIDVREHGSKNAGLTNVFRVLGWKPALPVLITDLSKGILAPSLAAAFVPEVSWWSLVCGLVVILGHSFTCFAQFKGGKGVLTALGVFIALDPLAAAVALGVWLVVVFSTRYVSLASILACLGLGITLSVEYVLSEMNPEKLPVLILGWVVALFVIVKHKSNVQRLMNGTENRFGKPKSESAESKS
jgi:acyl phosphate:glycerol-3-phosphate acyltransferase